MCVFAHSPLSSSPKGLKKHFHISDKLYTWMAINSRAAIGDWDSFVKIAEKKVLSISICMLALNYPGCWEVS